MGILADSEMGNFISISDFGTLKVAENHSGSIIEEVKPNEGQYPLKHLVNLPTRNCFAVSDGNGQVYLYQKSGAKFEFIKSLSV